jgi:hypothetical protein
MWAKLDDELLDHQKIALAGTLIGKNGGAIAIGFYAVCLLWSGKHLTDGYLPEAVITGFGHVENPRSIADALVKAGLLEKISGGFQVHDFDEYNPSAAVIRKRRKVDRLRKQHARNGEGT